MKKLQSLNGLRFIFFLCVFFSHYMMSSGRVLPNAGEFAVVFFFMLSGFSLSYGYGERIDTITYSDFIKKRLLRLWPMQVLTLLLRAIPIILIPLFVSVIDIKDIISFILKLFFLEGWIPDTQIIFNFNACAWYLSPLVFCYFLFPTLYKWIVKVKPIQIVVAVLVYLSIYAICVYFIPSERHQVFLYAAPYFRFFDFAIGILLFRVYRNRGVPINKGLKNSLLPELLLIVLIAVVAWLPLGGVPQVIKMASAYWIPAIIVILGYLLIENVGNLKIMKAKMIQRFGDASFEMYMTHLFLVSLFQHIAERFVAPENLSMQALLMLFCLFCSILMGLAVRQWYNIPVSNFIKKKMQ